MSAHSDDVSSQYITNPFTLALKGLSQLFDKAQNVFWFAIVVSVIGNIASIFSPNRTNDSSATNPSPVSSSEAASLVLVVLVAFIAILAVVLVISTFFLGIMGYTSAQLAKGHHAGLKEAIKATFRSFGRLLWINTVWFARLCGWYLLLIVPGIIMTVRYALTPTIAFAEPELKGGAVSSRSAQFTKGAWFDTAATTSVSNLITFGIFQMVGDISSHSQVYRQLKQLKDSGATKPPTHWLSYLIFIVPLVLFALLLVGLALLLGLIYAAGGADASY